VEEDMAHESGHKQNLKFRCADIVQSCSWETTGSSEEELMPQIEQHGREKHNMRSFDNATRNKVRESIRREAA
jgi:predicted small metal-binding protein